ncbi:MAG: DUF4097 family beta strand repeat-containing protein [Defluviitaleaceae bacterium]|nr:DUF4097 family beta strand repeat-containing protein [Defluviitaleaceae bacterium]
MTKYGFLNELDQLLSGLDTDERKEILEDYEEHFAFAKRAGKSDEEVMTLMGMPADIAREILENKVEGGFFEESDTYKLQEEALNKQAAALDEKAKALEEKLAAQAKILEEQAEALAAQKEAQEHTGFGHQVGSLVDTLTETVGTVVESVSEVITETFEHELASLPENAVESETLIQEVVEMTGVKNVVIKARNQKVDIRKTTYPTARVRLTRGVLAMKVENDTLYIESREIKRKFRISGLISIELSAELKIDLPEQVYDLIQAKTSNAKMAVSDIELDQLNLESSNGKLEIHTTKANELALQTSNGKIEVKDSTGHVHAKTTNGKIELTRIEGCVNVKSTNGKLEFEGITGDIEATTTNGKIKLDNHIIDQQVKMTTSNARIEITLQDKPEHATFELLTSHAKTKLFETDRNYDVFGDGRHQVKLSTSHAKIEVGLETDA